MIVVSRVDGLEVVTQSDHAHFAAELLTLWRRDGLPTNPRRAAILEATREHDSGWRESDSAPQIDPGSGSPYDFLSLPDSERLRIWRRGVERAAAETTPYAAALVTHHALELHREHAPDDAWERWRIDTEAQREGLLEGLGVGLETLCTDYRLLRVADLLSLGVAMRRQGGLEIGALQAHFDSEGGELALEPFPLAGSTTFRLPVRRLSVRTFDNSVDFAVNLTTQPWSERRVRVRPMAEAGVP